MQRHDDGDATKPDGGTPGLPVAGYPISEKAVSAWFRQTYGREASERELGVIINAMAQREATPPDVGPNADPYGWKIGPATPPADRR